IEGELACDLPGILSIQSELLLAHPGMSGITDGGVIRQSEKKAGIAEANVRAAHCRGLKRLTRFVGGKVINAQSVPIDEGRISLGQKLATKLVRVVALHPAQIGVKRRTLRDLVGPCLGADILHAARAAG